MTGEPTNCGFLTIEQVAEQVNVKESLAATGELRALRVGGAGYFARLLAWMRFGAGFMGQTRQMQRELSARFVWIGERRCAVVGA